MTICIQTIAGMKRRAAEALFSAPTTVLILLISVLVARIGVPAHEPAPSKPGWTLLLSDGFDGSADSSINTSNWGTGELETMNSSPDSERGTSALAWFSPSSSAQYAILHYVIPGQARKNVAMSYDSSAGRWGFTVDRLSSGQTLSYSYTYNIAGLQYDTATYSWTVP